MIPITINDKKYKIKAVSELTCSELLDLSKVDDISNINTQKYIVWQTGEKLDDVFFCKIDSSVETLIGSAPDFTKMPKPKGYDYSKIIETVGQRHQVEQCKLEGVELLIFVLAVAQARSNNISDVHKLRDEYMSRPFFEVLPAGFFFFKTLGSGRKSVMTSLKRLFPSTKTKN